MSGSPSAPFGRPRKALPESGMVRLQVNLPAKVARMVYAQAEAERRHISAIHTQALEEFYDRHPPESWTSMT